MDRLIADSVERERFRTAALGSFSGGALLLASLGVYSVVAFSTSERYREIGIRIALGAKPRAAVAQMTRRGLVPAILGLGLGLILSLGLTRFLESYLYEIDPTDPGVYAVAMIVGLLAVVLAAWLPARRAARVDPMTALRYE
jgi:putative ABC transport system permease protein